MMKTDPLTYLAVQHERGPRKPKYREHTELKALHNPIALTVSPFSKSGISALERHHYANHNNHYNHHHHHSIMNKIPPLISNSNSSDRNEMMSGLCVGANKSDTCQIGSLSNNTMNSSSTYFDSPAPPPPGLLQMLLNAEKSQELIWNSIRSNAVMGHLQASGLPFVTSGGISRMFDEMSPHSSPLFMPSFVTNSGACNLFVTAPPQPPPPPPPLPSQSTTPSSTTNSNETHTPDNESKNMSRGYNSISSNLSFVKPMHQQITTPTQWDSVHEVTARLLFMVIRWVKCLPTYRTLSKNDQITLLEDSWKDLFLLNMAQWSVTLDLVSPLPGAPAYLSRAITNYKANDSPTMASDVQYIQEIMKRFRQLSPDGTECSCLKAIVLFKPESFGLCDVHPVEMLQDQAQCILGDYVRHKYPRQPTRFGRLLLLIPCLRAISAITVEKLFFKETIGEIPVEKLLGDMYHMEKFD